MTRDQPAVLTLDKEEGRPQGRLYGSSVMHTGSKKS